MAAFPWICLSCKSTVTTPFCPRCGEEPVKPRDLTLHGFAEKAVHAFTSVDARTLRSIRTLVLRPGALTIAWFQGIRKPYVLPLSLFLIANVAFVAMQLLTGQHVFNSSLESHLHHQDWSPLAQSLLSRRLDETRRSLEDYAPVFDRRVALNAKSLVVLMSLAFSLLLPAVFFRERRPFMVHVAFSLHFYAFLLLLMSAALLAAGISAGLGFGGIETALVDNLLSAAMLLICAFYIFRAIGPVYDSRGVRRAVSAVLLVLAVAALVLGYRLALFLITLYST
jgi:uncharacterized protein DUF3667